MADSSKILPQLTGHYNYNIYKVVWILKSVIEVDGFIRLGKTSLDSSYFLSERRTILRYIAFMRSGIQKLPEKQTTYLKTNYLKKSLTADISMYDQFWQTFEQRKM